MTRARCASPFPLLLGVLFLLLPLQSFGQAVYGSIFGTVSDPTGAVIPNAKVTVTDVSKGTSEAVTTDQSGNYSVSHLIPDTYQVKVESSGFETAVSNNIQVSADTGARFDAALKTGAQSETVQVTAEAPQLKTDREDVATIFNERSLEQLPTFNRNFTSFLLLSPGTTKMGWSHASSENPQGSQQIFVNGQQFAGTGYELDGTDNEDPILGIIVVNPNLDSVTETKITTQNYDAEFGKAIAGIVTAQTKSGSNDIHGSAFEYRRSDANQARDPFTQFAPDPITHRLIPVSLWNQFGGSVGGAVIKDKLFYFGDYQGTREKTGNSFFETVPTNLVRSTCLAGQACNLSEYLNGGQNQIYVPGSQNAGTGTATAYANNIIPAGQISQQAVNLLKQLPAPTTSGTLNNYVASGFGIFNRDAFDTRADYNATAKLHIFGRYSFQNFKLDGKGAFGVAGGNGFGPGGFAGQSKTRNHSISSGFDYVVNNSLITDFRFGYFHYHVNVQPNDAGLTPMKDAGIPGINLGDPFTAGFSQLSFAGNASGDIQKAAGISEFGEGLDVGRCNCPLLESENQFQFVNNWTKTVGNHIFKVGGDIRYALNLRVPSDRHRTGELSFARDFTSNPNASKQAICTTQPTNPSCLPGGSALATILLGEVTTMSRYVSSSTDAAERQKRTFFYGQDTWRVTPKLTLNYGLRWEIYFPETVNANANGALLNLNDGNLHVAGVGSVPTNMGVDNSYKNLAPRLGIAYQYNDKTVVRMGYGRSFDIGVFGSIFGHTVTQNLPVLANQNLNPASSTSGVFTFTQGPPAPLAVQVPANGLLPLPVGINGRARPFNDRIPTLDAWNLTIQRQLSNTVSAELAYVGNKGTHVFAGNNPDINPNEPNVIGFKEGVPQNNRRAFFGKYGWTQDITYFANASSSNYNALQAKLDKRFSNGLQMLAHYTWSKALNFDQDYFAIQPHRGLVDFNRKHVFVLSSVYSLPFGHGKTFANNLPKWADYVVGGFELSSNVTWSSGLPFSVSYGECSADIDAGPCWASKTGSPSTNVTGLQHPAGGSPFRQFFVPVPVFTANGASGNGFTRPAAETFGSRNSLYGPRYFNTDMAIAKNFNIKERVNAQFRAEFFNIFNHPQLGNPSSCIDCSGSGQITDIASNLGQMRNIQFGVRFQF